MSVPNEKLLRPRATATARTGAGTSRNIIRIEAVAAGPVGGADAHQAGRELIQVGLAERNRAGLDEFPDHRGRLLRRIGEVRAACRRRDSLKIDVVFDDERDAIERQRFDRLRIEGGDVGHDLLARQSRNPDMMRVVIVGIVEQAFHDAARRVGSGNISGAKVGQTQVIACWHVPHDSSLHGVCAANPPRVFWGRRRGEMRQAGAKRGWLLPRIPRNSWFQRAPPIDSIGNKLFTRSSLVTGMGFARSAHLMCV